MVVSLPPGDDPFVLLDVPLTASQAEIRRAYFVRVRQFPPERAPDDFKRVRAAYEQINTPQGQMDATMLRFNDADPEVPELPPATPIRVNPGDVLRALRAYTDLGRTDWREDFREVKL